MPANIADIPPSVIASWPKPNYVDPVRRTWMPAFSLTWQIVSTILIAGRFFMRVRNKAGPLGFDDLFIGIGWILSIGLTTCAWLGAAKYGLDRHTWDVPFDSFPQAALVGWLAQVLFTFSTCATKISVLLFYQRMVVDIQSRVWLYAIYIAIGFTVVYGLGIFLALITVCRPLRAYWMVYDLSWHEPYTCNEAEALDYVIGILSVISDLYAVALPCVILQHYRLNVPRRQKVALNVIFGLGTLVAGAGIARTYYLIRLGSTYDTSWTGFNLYAWSLVECQLAIICACGPSLRAFYRSYISDVDIKAGWRWVVRRCQRSEPPTDRVEPYTNQISDRMYGEKVEHRVLIGSSSVNTCEGSYAPTVSTKDGQRSASGQNVECQENIGTGHVGGLVRSF